ncbi:MAG: ATP-dependent Clp protease adapter protein ClpS [Micavibrio sp.]|nr:ATP-dependent Clp protease adapter protein ClpS [Micavibrio sp.]
MTTAGDTIVEKKERVAIGPPPKMYNVVVRDNTVTEMLFVVSMLTDVFNMNKETAINKMLEVHKQKRTNIGPFTRDIAEAKKNRCMDYARNADLPQNRELLTTMEPAP